ncbi:MAG: 2-iminoacetate synthase ThiH, partial [Chlorobiales bacterium]|nr:2-iminoacetate synthase ThiH [Chlorobiales bacterium]
SVEIAAKKIHRVAVEAFPMSVSEYHALADAGCSGVTIYQETYDQEQYARLHIRGPKKDYFERLETPVRVLEGGIKSVGLGVLLGLSDPIPDALKLFRHVRFLGKKFWRAGLSVSFPRIRPQVGGFQPEFLVSDEFLARMIFAFRIALPDVELVLSTRESASFRDGMAGLGISRMSVASRTTVGGYSSPDTSEMHTGQFEVNDDRNVDEITKALRARNLDVVFKNWESVYSGTF